ncbi:hypothetical protein K439DRAFT_1617400 [Ramaria rubella]|nr:hypothetical protein K439DRAFT_1617400 [Ramaria rubella]
MSPSASICTVLPPELTDQIIDHLHDDRLALRTCNLTCKAWTSSAKFHLFHDVKLDATSADALTCLLVTNPIVGIYVRCLDIQGGFSSYGKPQYVNGVIPFIASRFIRLDTLRIENLRTVYPMVQESILEHFTTIRTLLLCGVTFFSFYRLTALLRALPRLEHLHLESIWWKEETLFSPHYVFPISPACLRSISIDQTSSLVLDWLASHYPVLPINTVIHTLTTKSDIPWLTRLLNVTGPALEHLTLCIYSIPNNLMTPQASDLARTSLLSSNTSLRTLVLDHIRLIDPTSPLHTWIPVLLSQVNSSQVENVTFRIVWNDIHDIQSPAPLDLEWIDDILTGARFSGLKWVNFDIAFCEKIGQEARAIIKRRMGKASGRGLLVFHGRGHHH